MSISRRFSDVVPERSSLRVQYTSSRPSITVKSAAADCDINRILRRYSATGELPNARRGAPQFADVTHLQGDPVSLRQREAEFSAAATEGLSRDAAAAKAKKAADAAALAPSPATSSPAPTGAAPAS